jgi:mono/diheme cytochrome c family protein
MSAVRKSICAALLAGCATLAAYAQDDLFAFIPDGGRTLLGDLIGSGKASPGELLSSRRSREEWLAYLQGLDSGLDPVQQETLAAYLAATMPAAETGGQTLDTNGLALPRDGRDLVLEYCQSCHIITVVVTQDRSREAWLGMMNRASHVEIDTTRQEREALADYLVLNGGIPIEDVPEELRAGGATY